MIYSSRLSIKRIILSLIIFCIIPLFASLINLFIKNHTLSYMFSLNICGSILIMYDWNLFGIHYNRFKNNLGDSNLYTIVGIVLFAILLFINQSVLHANILLPDSKSLKAYAFGIPAIIIAFSYMHAIVINISFKCLTDHMKIRSNELLIILTSGLLFGLFYTLVFSFYFNFGFNIMSFINQYIYNVIITCTCSYLYNQSNSFLPGIISLGTVYLVFIVSSIL